MESIETIKDLLNITIDQATQVKGVIEGTIDPFNFKSVDKWIDQCYHFPNKAELKLKAINEIIGGYGLEYIQHVTDSFKNLQGLNYVNMGDTYTNTVIFDYKLNSFRLCSYGDIVESDMESYI